MLVLHIKGSAVYQGDLYFSNKYFLYVPGASSIAE